VLDRQAGEVHVAALLHHLLAGRRRHRLGRHVEHLLEDRQLVPGVLEALRRLGLLEEGQQLAHLAQRALPVVAALAHAQRHPLGRAEEVGEHRHRMALGVLEQDRRAAGAQHAVADLGHLEVRVDLGLDPLELAEAFQLGDEVTQVGVAHGGGGGMENGEWGNGNGRLRGRWGRRPGLV
jgi:hypothetical protein